jgi:hypothetical protein
VGSTINSVRAAIHGIPSRSPRRDGDHLPQIVSYCVRCELSLSPDT